MRIMTATTHAMHHDPGAAAQALAQYEADRRHVHDKVQVRHTRLYALGRILFATLFVVSAFAKLADYRVTLDAVQDAVVDATLLLPIAIGIELIGGVLLMVGFQARRTAVALIAYLALITALMHGDLSLPLNRSFALANLAFAGALLMIAAHGAGTFSVDKLMARTFRS
jgi:putative oxidoreductase